MKKRTANNEFITNALSVYNRKREPDTHKGDYGRVLVIAGSEGMTGAAVLASQAARRMGCGIVYIASLRGLIHVYDVNVTEAVKIPIGSRDDVCWNESHIDECVRASEGMDAIVIGSGLGSDDCARYFTRKLLKHERFATSSSAIVLDADGINAYEAKRYGAIVTEELQEAARRFGGRLVMTPHEGEMARLLSRSANEIHNTRVESVTECAKLFTPSVVLLKGAATLVYDELNDELFTNTTGDAAMSCGGSGDVLAGMIAGLAATESRSGLGLELGHNRLADVVCIAATLHGICGEIAAQRYGQRYAGAGEIIEGMGALRDYDGQYQSLG